MNAKRIGIGIAVAVVLFLGWRALFVKPLPDEQRIHVIIHECVTALKEKRLSDCMDHVDKSFVGRAGQQNANKTQLKQFLTFRAMRGGGLSIRIVTQDIQVVGNSATAELRAVVAKGGLQGAAQGDATARKVTLSFSRIDGDWKIVGSTYGGFVSGN